MPSKRMIRWLCVLVVVFLFLQYNVFSPQLAWTRINQLPIEVETRLTWWNWKDTSEEIACQARQTLTKKPIPKIVHFILPDPEGEDSELSLWDYLAIKAALLRIQPDGLRVHCYRLNKQNQYWKKLEHRITSVLHDRQKVLGALADKGLSFAHQADILRLDILREHGGIYLDTDAFALRPFDDLLTNNKDTVMGYEGGNRYGLCNAVIVSRPFSAFISRWKSEYKSFDWSVWNYHSVLLPKRLALQHPQEVCALSPTTFFWPTWNKEHIKYMHEPISADEVANLRANMSKYNGAMYENQLVYHAWGHSVRSLYLSHLTEEDVLSKDTRFNILLRDIVAAKI